MLIIYGIPNCDSCRKTCAWLDSNAVKYRFHDLRKDGVETELLQFWARSVDWRNLLNRRSTTWRGLPESTRKKLDETEALALMTEHPMLIKRPVTVSGKKITVGFNEEVYRELTG